MLFWRDIFRRAGDLKKMQGLNFSIDKILQVLNYDDKKLKSYLNLNHGSILLSLFQEEHNNKIIEIKVDFLQENIHKYPRDIIALLKEKEQDNEYFNYYKDLILLLASHNLDEHNFQVELGKLNEKTDNRKRNGIYYTPEDITDFIIYNGLYQLLATEFGIKFRPTNPSKIANKILNLSKKNIEKTCEIISRCSVFDPTCGTAAFLVQVLQIKLDLLSKIKREISPPDIYNIIDNLYGNDLDPYSVYISKTRLLFRCLDFCTNLDLGKITHQLDKNFSTDDFILENERMKFDLIFGNPPYVEKSKTKYNAIMKYGNTYGDVIHNSINLLNSEGILGFIIPLSYISTARMGTLRNFVEKQSEYQFILNYADRPDCLFRGVHQKLSILFIKKNANKKSKIYTSDYAYWYKHERYKLFINPQTIQNKINFRNCYVKIGTKIEERIFKKVIGLREGIIHLNNTLQNNNLYLNMRATFWVKSLITRPDKLNEYSVLKLSKENLHLVNCILNSSLFWWFWIKVSDCWHITNKELENFKVPLLNHDQYLRLKTLSKMLDSCLEKTKEKVNTKQVLYEYKHKLCKSIIDKIDIELSKLYHLNKRELNFIKNYKENYRLGQ